VKLEEFIAKWVLEVEIGKFLWASYCSQNTSCPFPGSSGFLTSFAVLKQKHWEREISGTPKDDEKYLSSMLFIDCENNNWLPQVRHHNLTVTLISRLWVPDSWLQISLLQVSRAWPVRAACLPH
jgi:hypothetical protein